MSSFDEDNGIPVKKKTRRRNVLLAAGCIAVLYLGGVTNKWWPTPDSALYLGLGRSLAEGKGYQFNGGPSNTVPPLFPLALAGVRLLFGPSYWAPHLMIATCGIASLLFIYLVVSRLENAAMALAALLATGISYGFYHNAHRILTDIPFVAFFWAFLYALLRFHDGRWYWLGLAAILVVIGLSVRIPGIILLGPLGLGFVFDGSPAFLPRKARTAGIVVMAVSLLAGAFWYAVAVFVSHKTPHYVATTPLGATFGMGNFATFLFDSYWNLALTLSEMFFCQDGRLMIVPGTILLSLIGIGMFVYWKNGLRSISIGIALYIMALAFLSTPGVGIRLRYMLAIQPLLLLACFRGVARVAESFSGGATKGAPSQRVLWVAAAVLTAVVVLSNAPKILREAVYYGYLSHTDRYYAELRKGDFQDHFPVADLIDRTCPERACIAAADVSIMHFLTRRTVVPLPEAGPGGVPDAAAVIELLAGRPDVCCVIIENPRRGREGEGRNGATPIREFESALVEAGMSPAYSGRKLQVFYRPARSGNGGR